MKSSVVSSLVITPGGMCAQVPQELGALTWLHTLYLRYNKARRTKHMKVHKDGSGNVLLPKMAVTESSLLWLLRCKHMQQVSAHQDIAITLCQPEILTRVVLIGKDAGSPEHSINLCRKYSLSLCCRELLRAGCHFMMPASGREPCWNV